MDLNKTTGLKLFFTCLISEPLVLKNWLGWCSHNSRFYSRKEHTRKPAQAGDKSVNAQQVSFPFLIGPELGMIHADEMIQLINK